MCSLCGSYFTNLFSHAACSCNDPSDFHNDWWNDGSNNFDMNLGAEPCSLTENEHFIVLLGCHTQIVFYVSSEKNFRKRNSRLFVQSCGRYKRLCDKWQVSIYIIMYVFRHSLSLSFVTYLWFNCWKFYLIILYTNYILFRIYLFCAIIWEWLKEILSIIQESQFSRQIIIFKVWYVKFSFKRLKSPRTHVRK